MKKIVLFTFFLVIKSMSLQAQFDPNQHSTPPKSQDNGQSYENKYFPVINQKLNEGNCERAKMLYNVYKEMSNRENKEIENKIHDCIRKKQTNNIYGYVDLGLPSGTLWKKDNEMGFYSYKKAVDKFGSTLPTIAQFRELIKECQWEWIGNGFKISGSNGNYILLPAVGYDPCGIYSSLEELGDCGKYWTATQDYKRHIWYIDIDKFGCSTRQTDGEWCPSSGFSVRLVKNY